MKTLASDGPTWRSLLAGVEVLHVEKDGPPVAATVARAIGRAATRRARLVPLIGRARPRPASLAIGFGRAPASVAKGDPWMALRAGDDRRVTLDASHPHHLYFMARHLIDDLLDRPAVRGCEIVVRPPFAWQRPAWDLYFGQAARTVRGLEPEVHISEMARLGFTHLEVNALAAPDPIEEGVPHEVYPRFYTYGPALDQFVDSFLNRGIYPAAWLAANRRRLRETCALARRYGLSPSMTCFEPRSVPESLLARYPELRGARVDHPFRSFKPRFNLAVSHPVVREHYREMIHRLLAVVPELACLSIWSNDSGAGFEFTKSLYVGANGSAYVVREWQGEDAVIQAAARNAAGFLQFLREAAAEIRPGFRVATRLEPFGPEREAVLAALGRGVDIETPSLLRKGWETPYRHPRYPDRAALPFTIYNQGFLAEERHPMEELARRDCRTHVMHSHGPVNNFEPLLQVPSPWLTHAKLEAMRKAGVRHLLHWGGIAPPSSVPFDINAEVFRSFQLDSGQSVDEVVVERARRWAGPSHHRILVRAWKLAERAVRGYVPHPLYFSWGVWYRILVRPLVPDIEAIPERDRLYYERHLLATHHNPNRVDLARDILWTLVTPAEARQASSRVMRNALPPLQQAIDVLTQALHGAPPVIIDQLDRLRALQCWMTTHGHVHTWIAEVHGYESARDAPMRARCRTRLRAMIGREIANARTFLRLLREERTEVLAISAVRETTFIYDRNVTRHLETKIELMRRYRDVTPRIASDLMWRVRGLKGKTSGPASRCHPSSFRVPSRQAP